MEALTVCRRCLCAIESREGCQRVTPVQVSADDPDESTCAWCGESGFDTLYRLD